ncbi:hypothetical protein VNI00_006855 [Paramarasmius palmivorus]|uniref:Uncharacterized protein n=1 Tax=Paramarasmius palmivorus TaxID=297713 RepID=A0AAW0D955_9AGAR
MTRGFPLRPPQYQNANNGGQYMNAYAYLPTGPSDGEVPGSSSHEATLSQRPASISSTHTIPALNNSDSGMQQVPWFHDAGQYLNANTYQIAQWPVPENFQLSREASTSQRHVPTYNVGYTPSGPPPMFSHAQHSPTIPSVEPSSLTKRIVASDRVRAANEARRHQGKKLYHCIDFPPCAATFTTRQNLKCEVEFYAFGAVIY